MSQKFSLRSAGLRRLPSDLGLAIVAAALFTSVSPLRAQEAGALVEKLLQKGLLTTQEADEVRAEMQKDAAPSSQAKISLSNSVTQLQLYGDLRLRWQYKDNSPVVDNSTWHSIEQDRFRYRLRLNADVQIGRNWFAGVELQTGQTPDSGFQSYSSGFNNDSIFVSRAFLGYQDDWLKIVAGKQANPFYTTDLLWDPDINPAGITETIALHKLPLFGGGAAGPSGSGKESVLAPSGPRPWEVTLVAGQFIAGDNGKFNNTGDLGTDPWIFDEQLIVKYNFNKATSITFAPGFLAENAAHVTGALNTLPFSDEGAVVLDNNTITTTVAAANVTSVKYSATGVPTKTVTPTTTTTTVSTAVAPVVASGQPQPTNTGTTATAVVTGAAVVTTGAATGLPTDPSKAGQTVTSTATTSTSTATKTTTNSLPEVAAEDADLHILTAPGDISFTLAGLKSKFYWDFAYNFSGQDRFNNVYQLKDFGSRQFRPRDAFAWLVGLQLGEVKKKGDWVVFADYRETGIASIDPNLNDNEVAGGALNMRGFKLGLAYAITDAVVVQATGYIFRSLDSSLSGGRATSPGGIAPYTSYDEVTVDLNIKF